MKGERKGDKNERGKREQMSCDLNTVQIQRHIQHNPQLVLTSLG